MPKETIINPFPTFKPTGAERKAVLEEIAVLEGHKRQILESIRQVEARLPFHRYDRAILEHEVAKKLASISPIRWVPFEILECIFEYYVEDIDDADNADEANNTDNLCHSNNAKLLNLQLVSKAWCCVVKYSPQLWTQLNVVGPFHLDLLPSYRKHIDLYALNSGRLPMRVTFWSGTTEDFSTHLTHKEESDRLEAMNRLLGYLILRTSERWALFDLRILRRGCYAITPPPLESVYPYMLGHATKLRHLVIRETSPFFTDQNREDTFLSLLSSHFSYYPKVEGDRERTNPLLQTLELFDVPIKLQSGLSPLKSLRELNIGFNQDSKWGDLLDESLNKSWLSLFPQLRKLTLNASDVRNVPRPYVNNQWGLWSDIQPIMHTEEYEAKHLVELHLQGPVPSWALYNVAFPVLKTVRIGMNKNSSHILMSHLMRDTDWGALSLGTVRNLYLSCMNCRPFWFTRYELERAYNANDGWELWYKNQEKIRAEFSTFLNVETVYAPSCIWKQIDEVFGSADAVIRSAGEVAGFGFLPVSGERLRFLLQEKVEYIDWRDLDPYHLYCHQYIA